jgi:hypothetical protein
MRRINSRNRPAFCESEQGRVRRSEPETACARYGEPQSTDSARATAASSRGPVGGLGGGVSDYTELPKDYGHSYLSATMGSTLVARLAGTYPASSATAISSAATLTNVTGSSVLNPKRKATRI